jgi:hypothetical protein
MDALKRANELANERMYCHKRLMGDRLDLTVQCLVELLILSMVLVVLRARSCPVFAPFHSLVLGSRPIGPAVKSCSDTPASVQDVQTKHQQLPNCYC